MDLTTADLLTMNDDDYLDYLATIIRNDPFPDHDEPDEFRQDRNQWAVEDTDR